MSASPASALPEHFAMSRLPNNCVCDILEPFLRTSCAVSRSTIKELPMNRTPRQPSSISVWPMPRDERRLTCLRGEYETTGPHTREE